jgi:hypothetical protein
MRERKAVTRVLIERYRKARKKEKGRILDELIELTGYCRCYGAHLLRRYGQRLRKGKITLLAQLPVKARRRPRSKTYDAAVVEVLKPLVADHRLSLRQALRGHDRRSVADPGAT